MGIQLSTMGSWGRGPFENDGAGDFVRDLRESGAPAEGVAEALHRVIEASRDEYLDVDDGHACVAACELIALANGQGTAPGQVSSLLSELAPNAGLLQLAIRALPRVLDPKHSELADLRRDELEVFDALYERLVAARGEGATPLINFGALLREPAEVAAPPVPMPWGESAPPDLAKMYATPALRSATVALGATWVLVGQGVLNVYGELDEAGVAQVSSLKVVQVQFGRRFRVSAKTVALVDRIFEKHPAAVLSLTLNGHGAFDDTSVLSQLPHLRRVVLNGHVQTDAVGVLAKYGHLHSAFVNGTSAAR